MRREKHKKCLKNTLFEPISNIFQCPELAGIIAFIMRNVNVITPTHNASNQTTTQNKNGPQ
jgi:hypothetical protein